MTELWRLIVELGTLIGVFAVLFWLLGLTLLGCAITAMVMLLALTRNKRNPANTIPVRPAVIGVPLTIWMARWPRFLRHVLRKHHMIAGEQREIRRQGLGAWLRADDLYSWTRLDEAEVWLREQTPLVCTDNGRPLLLRRMFHKAQRLGAMARFEGEPRSRWVPLGSLVPADEYEGEQHLARRYGWDPDR